MMESLLELRPLIITIVSLVIKMSYSFFRKVPLLHARLITLEIEIQKITYPDRHRVRPQHELVRRRHSLPSIRKWHYLETAKWRGGAGRRRGRESVLLQLDVNELAH